MHDPPNIFLSAGEASGDHYGAALITALKKAMPDALYTGLGGTQMEAAGQRRMVRAEDVAVMGITEILLHIPRILASYRRLVRAIQISKPDVAVLIDFPDVNFRLAKHLKAAAVPVIWFVSPQLWAWKRRRLRWVQERVTKMLTIFPFEQPFYANRGVQAEFVGHPLAEQTLPTISRSEYATANAIDPAKAWISLLPGSRDAEIAANLPAMLSAAALFGNTCEYLIPIAPTVDKSRLHSIRRQIAKQTVRMTLVRDARAALLHSRAAVVASGTATVQAAVIGTPLVVVYRVSKLTFAAAKRLVRYPAEIRAKLDIHGNLPIAMVNLIAGRRAVPELLQDQFTAENIIHHLKTLLNDGPERESQINALAEVRRKLESPTGQPPIEHLRDAVLTALNRAPGTIYAADAYASNH